MSGHLRAYVELRGHGARGPRYRVRMNKPNGTVIIDATTEPLFAAARVLLSRGVTGKLQLWDAQRLFPRMSGDIEHLAGLTVTEGQFGIALRRYAERTADGDTQDEAPRDAQNVIGRPESVLQASSTMDAA